MRAGQAVAEPASARLLPVQWDGWNLSSPGGLRSQSFWLANGSCRTAAVARFEHCGEARNASGELAPGVGADQDAAPDRRFLRPRSVVRDLMVDTPAYPAFDGQPAEGVDR